MGASLWDRYRIRCRLFALAFCTEQGVSIDVVQRRSNGQSIVFDTTIKAQWSHYGLLALLKLTGLHFFRGPSTGCAILFGSTNRAERGLAETLDQTDDSENEETEDEERHGKYLLDNEKERLNPFPMGRPHASLMLSIAGRWLSCYEVNHSDKVWFLHHSCSTIFVKWKGKSPIFPSISQKLCKKGTFLLTKFSGQLIEYNVQINF